MVQSNCVPVAGDVLNRLYNPAGADIRIRLDDTRAGPTEAPRSF